MSQKDYEAIAHALSASRPERRQRACYSQWLRDVNAIAVVLSSDNPRFDRGRFESACGVNE